MLNSKFLHVLVLLLSLQGFSQADPKAGKPEPIVTDRPDQTETPTLVPKGMVQIETGFEYDKIDGNASSALSPTVLFKYGVNENFELRLITEYETDKTGDEKLSGLNPVLIGAKITLCDEKGIIPKTAFLGHLLLPDLASKDFKADYYATEFRLTMQHTLSDKIDLGYNLGAQWDGFSPEPTFIYTLTTGFELSEKTSIFAEIYGFAPQHDKADHRFDTGLTYLISDNMAVDFSGGFGITDNAPDYFVSGGFSFRI